MKIDSFHFNTDVHKKKERFDLYYENIKDIFHISLPKENIQNFDAIVNSYLLDNIVFAECSSKTTQHFIRDERKITENGHDHFIIQLFLKGKTIGQGRNEGKNGDGSTIFFIDCSKPWHAVNPHFCNLSLAIPRIALSENISGIHNLHGHALRVEGNPFAKIFENFVFDLYKHITFFEKNNSSILSKNCIDLLIAALRYDNNQKFSEADRYNLIGNQIKQYIEANLSNPNLSIKTLMDKFSISRSSLYRLFPEQSGGLGQFIKMRRLNRAYLKIANKKQQQTISEIAYECGFTNISSFSRSFNQQFSISPSAVIFEEQKNNNQKSLWYQWLSIT